MVLQSKGHEAATGFHIVWGKRSNVFPKASTSNPKILFPKFLLQVLMFMIWKHQMK